MILQGTRPFVARVRHRTLGLALAVLALSAAPLHAAGAEYQGWFLGLDAALAQPTGLDQNYAELRDLSSNFVTRETLDNDAGIAFAAKVGYVWGELGGLQLSYWSFDNDDDLSKSDLGHVVYPTVFGAFAYNNVGTYGLYPDNVYGVPVTYSVTSSVKASVIDLDYFRAMDVGERFSVKWIVGLRTASYEEDLAFDGVDGYGYVGYTIRQSKHIESDAIGVKAGVRLDFGFTDRFSLQGGLAFSILQGSSEATARQDMVDGANFIPPALFVDQVQADDDHVHGEIRDIDLRAVWSWPAFDLYLGYGAQTWEGLVEDPISGTVGVGGGVPMVNGTHATRESIGFDMIHAGVVFRFGGGG